MVVNLKGPGTLVKGALKPITVSRVRLTFTDGTLSEYEHRIDGASLSDLSDLGARSTSPSRSR